MASHDELRATAPQAPAPSRALLRAREEQQAHHAQRAQTASRSAARGLLLLAFLVLAASIARAGFERVFVSGWWRHW